MKRKLKACRYSVIVHQQMIKKFLSAAVRQKQASFILLIFSQEENNEIMILVLKGEFISSFERRADMILVKLAQKNRC